MAYKQTDWKDHVTEFENRYTETQNADGSVTHTKVEGEVIQQGTPMSATNFNNMECGIGETSMMADLIYTYVMLKLGHSDKTLEGLDESLSAAIDSLQSAITNGTITAKQAETLTSVLGLTLGGTGASTAAQARTNLSVPSNADLICATVLADAQRSIDVAVQRDHEERLLTVEAQLAELA